MSNNIHNKEYRKKLIERYLNADSTSQEEGLLKDYFTNNSADEDEKDIAYLIKIGQCKEEAYNSTLTPDTGAEEYDRIVGGVVGKRNKRIRYILAGLSACAAACVLYFTLVHERIEGKSYNLSPIEIAEGINAVAEVTNGAEEITANTTKEGILVTVSSNGKVLSTYMITKDNNGSIKLTANN